jgi:hypothetical protein
MHETVIQFSARPFELKFFENYDLAYYWGRPGSSDDASKSSMFTGREVETEAKPWRIFLT